MSLDVDRAYAWKPFDVGSLPKFDTPCYMVVEGDEFDDEPWIIKAVCKPGSDHVTVWLMYPEEEQEPLLQQRYSVAFWRYI